MIIRRAAETDLPAIGALYREARKALGQAGVDQWQGEYPNEDSAREDMARGWCYVAEDQGRVVATACLGFGQDPTYDVIEKGGWQSTGDYGFLHRAAVSASAKGKGIAPMFFQELVGQARARGVGAIRGDTHRDNQPMRRVMEKCGLEYRGIIYAEDGTARMAYERVL